MSETTPTRHRRSRTPMVLEGGFGAAAPEQRWEKHLDTILLYGLCALLCFGPLAYGAVEAWSMAVLEGGATLLFFLWCMQATLRGRMQIEIIPLFAPMILFAAVVAAQWLLGLSAYPQATRDEAILYVAYAQLIFVASQMLRDEEKQIRFLTILAVFGFLVAVFAIIQDLTSNGMLYWFRKPRQESSIFGPYANHNHFAGLMELLTPLPLVMALSSSLRGSQRALTGFAAMVMGASILLSVSRAGISSFLIQMVFLGAVSLSQKRSRNFRWGVAAIFLAMLIFIFWLGASRVLDRWMPVNVHTEMTGGRLAVTRDALHMGTLKPVAGWGLGTFPTVYPQFRSFYTDLFVNQTHNDYAQIWVETGLLGTVAMLWFLFALVRAGLRRASRWRTSVNARLAAFAGCLGILVHSLADFNLHIPANAAMFYVLCALAVLPSEEQRNKVRQMPIARIPIAEEEPVL